MRRGFDALLNIFAIGIGGPLTLICAIAAIPAFTVHRPWGHAVQRFWGKAICWLLGIHVSFLNLERLPPAGCVLASNHESMFDIVVLASLPVDVKWISKKSVGAVPFLGWAMKAMGCYFVARDQSSRDLNVMSEVEAGVKSGSRVIIFPEGTRTRTGDLLPFKKGAFKTAQNSGVPLVPIGITGTRSIAPPGRLPLRRHHRVFARIGEAMQISPKVPLNPEMEIFRSRLVALLEENRIHSSNSMV
jgi:1-acyl-sn-glycerol-3-phosphate acyltransferase